MVSAATSAAGISTAEAERSLLAAGWNPNTVLMLLMIRCSSCIGVGRCLEISQVYREEQFQQTSASIDQCGVLTSRINEFIRRAGLKYGWSLLCSDQYTSEQDKYIYSRPTTTLASTGKKHDDLFLLSFLLGTHRRRLTRTTNFQISGSSMENRGKTSTWTLLDRSGGCCTILGRGKRFIYW